MREQQPLQGCCASKAMSRPGAPLPSLTLATAFISGEPEDQPANVPCAMGGGRRIAGRARASAHIAPQEERCFGTRKRSPWARLPAVDSRGPAAVATSRDEQTVNRLQSPDCPQEAGNPIPYRSDTVTETRAPSGSLAKKTHSLSRSLTHKGFSGSAGRAQSPQPPKIIPYPGRFPCLGSPPPCNDGRRDARKD